MSDNFVLSHDQHPQVHPLTPDRSVDCQDAHGQALPCASNMANVGMVSCASQTAVQHRLWTTILRKPSGTRAVQLRSRPSFVRAGSGAVEIAQTRSSPGQFVLKSGRLQAMSPELVRIVRNVVRVRQSSDTALVRHRPKSARCQSKIDPQTSAKFDQIGQVRLSLAYERPNGRQCQSNSTEYDPSSTKSGQHAA